jgi:hypothetical protein
VCLSQGTEYGVKVVCSVLSSMGKGVPILYRGSRMGPTWSPGVGDHVTNTNPKKSCDPL